MKRNCLTLFFIIFYFYCHSQETNTFEIGLDERNNVIAIIDTISYSKFPKNAKPLKWIEPKVNEAKDSIFNAIRLKFPDSFKDSSSCLILKRLNENRTLCIDTSYLNDPKSWVTYTQFDYKLKFIFFNVSYYEADEYVLFNPEKQIIKSIWSYPTFIDEKVIYSVSDFNALNGSSSFEFQSLLKDEFFALYVDSWKIISFSQVKNKFYFEFSSEWKNESNKYIRLTLKII